MNNNLAALVAHKYVNWQQADEYYSYGPHFSTLNMVKYSVFCVRKALRRI